jgi:hypothetical protein
MSDIAAQRKIVALLIASLLLPYGIYRLWDAWSFTSQGREVAGEVVQRDSSRFTIRYVVGDQAFQIQEDLPIARGMWSSAAGETLEWNYHFDGEKHVLWKETDFRSTLVKMGRSPSTLG